MAFARQLDPRRWEAVFTDHTRSSRSASFPGLDILAESFLTLENENKQSIDLVKTIRTILFIRKNFWGAEAS